jgi:hypothetical protein
MCRQERRHVASCELNWRRSWRCPTSARLRGLGGEPGTMTPEQFARFNLQEYERYGRLIREANIKPE